MNLSDSSASHSERHSRSVLVRGSQTGLTLIEMLVGMAVFLIVIAGVYLVFQTFQNTFWRGSAEADIHQSVRFAMEEMRREIRSAGYDPSATGLAGVQTLGTNSVSFITSMEFFPNPPSAPTSALVTYSDSWDNQQKVWMIQRKVQARSGGVWGSAPWTIVARVANESTVHPLTFSYWQANGTAATIGTDVKRIQVQIQGSGKGQSHQVTTDIFLRNQ